MYKIFEIFLLFIMYSVVGYIIEVINIYLKSNKFVVERGFLIGPYLPIFGSGSFLILYALKNYKNDMFALIVFSFVLCGLLEYFTSVIMEKIFGFRWWDYSDKKYNVNGRICLEYLIYFGISSILIVRAINPLFISFIGLFSEKIIIFIGIILSLTILSDFIISVIIAINIKKKIKLFVLKDNTFEIKEEVKRSLSNLNFLSKRLLKSFPNIKTKFLNLQKQFKNISK